MIVIPMAGRSQRFFDAGYDRAKYELPLQGRSVFAHAVGSFEAVLGEAGLLVIAAREAEAFVRAECAAMGIAGLRLALLDAPTRGQAETVELGLAQAGVGDGEPITIFNIDTFRPGFRWPGAPLDGMDGWLEVFRGSGANWSYVRPADGPEPLALETTEKRPISDLCCTGLYHFARAGDFRAALAEEHHAPQAPELYVAPLYNALIRRGARIGYSLIERQQVVFCGVPAEYEALRAGGR